MVLFANLVHAMGREDDREEALYKLAEKRADIVIGKAFYGFDIDPEDALELVRNMDVESMSREDQDKRDRLIAAMSNLIEFAACEEYQVYKNVEQLGADYSEEEWENEDVEDPLSEFAVINNRYNGVYAEVEDGDVEYAMAMASQWIKWDKDTTIIYMTQDDDRVRPWHYALHGYAAKRDDFPAWMIPPIEWACRCYLITDAGFNGKIDLSNIYAKKKSAPKKPKELDGIFKESVCKCGRIFSDEHPYFQIDDKDSDMLNGFVERLRKKYYGG